MPLKESPKFSPTKLSMLEVPQPGVGGLNLFDLEYEQEINQSPYMLNMMYRNGTFSKRYGQEIDDTYPNKIYATEYFNGHLFVHSGTKMYIDEDEVQSLTLADEKGFFIKFYQTLYYKCDGVIYEYKQDLENPPHDWKWGEMKPYVPEVFTECQPQKDGTYNRMDDLNLLTLKYTCVYNSDNTANYFPYGNEDDIIDWSADADDTKHSKIIVKVDDVLKVEGTDYTVNETDKKIVFANGHIPPASGSDNVSITFTMKESNLKEDRTRLLNSKYHINYGANGSSHLFLAGGGDAKLFYSDSYDATYFPENNWIILGSTEKDITGFGLQYNILIAFKPTEIYSLYSYQTTSSMVTTENEDLIGTEAFGSNIVNGGMGCDAPYSIQLINNQVTWYSSRDGICTLVSTNISDERNVRVLSRNINNSNNFGVKGILEYEEDLDSIVSVDYDYKYFLVFPNSGMCYMWDYAIAPFSYTASKVTDPKTLDWYLFDNFYVKQFVTIGHDLLFITDKEALETNLIKLNNSFADINFEDGEEKSIKAYFMTPFFQFNAIEYLKNIQNLFVQCRGDTASVINPYYYTEESVEPEKENDVIRIGGRLWEHFTWDTFQWLQVNRASVFRRRCGLKKVQMCAFYFENDEINRDMSISHIGLQYQIVKTIR